MFVASIIYIHLSNNILLIKYKFSLVNNGRFSSHTMIFQPVFPRYLTVYQTLEPLFADYRKLRYRNMQGKMWAAESRWEFPGVGSWNL